MRISGFNGRVIFDCYPPNMKHMVVVEAMQRDVPEARDFPNGSATSVLFWNLSTFLGRTDSIEAVEIEGAEPDTNVEALLAFWEFAASTTDYRAIWNRFLMTCDTPVNEAWLEAISQTEDKRLLAPEAVRPGAPDDAALEAEGESGKKKSKLVTRTSKPLTTAQETSSPPEATATPSG